MEYIAFDCHKKYTYAVVEDKEGRVHWEGKIVHERGALAAFLKACHPGSPVAVETVGNWYWIVDEIEKAGCVPRLVHAAKAKLMLGMTNKTDKLDARVLRGSSEREPFLRYGFHPVSFGINGSSPGQE